MIELLAQVDAGTVAGGAGLGAVGTAIVFGVNYYFKRKREADNEERAQSRKDKQESAQWSKLNRIDEKMAQHQLDDAQSFADLDKRVTVLDTKLTNVQGTQTEMNLKLDELLKHSRAAG